MKPAKPAWWQLYIVVPIMIGLFFVEHQIALSAFGHEVAQAVIVVLAFALMTLWLRANQTRFIDRAPGASEELHITVYDLAQETTSLDKPGHSFRARKPKNNRYTWSRSSSAERFERGRSVDSKK